MSNPLHDIKLALGADFLTAFSGLPQKQQKKVRRFLDEFAANPAAPTHNYEKIKGAKDDNLRSVRIDQDYRGILLKPEQGNVYLLLWVDKHDDAYQWAMRRICAVHPETGTMQVVLTREAAAESMAMSAPVPPPKPEPKPAPALFKAFSNEELISLGVPAPLLGHVREIKSEDELDRLEKVLPREAFEATFMLAAGYGVDEARTELGIARETTIDTSDFAAAVERDSSKRQFIVITDAAEMEKLLAAPLEQWRVFLHPSQRRLVERQASGPVRVLGSAGTGKTVVAMHRAVWLTRNSCAPGQKILFTTFTKNLAADIASNLKKLCSREEWERIEVVNLDAWTRRFLEKQGFNLKLTYESSSQEDLWQKALALAGPTVAFPPEFVRGEWDNVIQAHGIETCEAYLVVSRVGRSHRLSRPERKQLWPVFEEYRALLSERGLSEPADAFRTASRLIGSRSISFPYRAVLVDESQDFGNEAFRLIRALVPPSEDDLFLVGDAHQRIYGHQVVLSRCGIEIRGRSRKLRINYRTTEELKNWATGLLRGLSFDDLDAGTDDDQGVRSLVHGEPPVLHTCANETAVAEAISEHVKQLMARDQATPESICVVAGTHRELEEYQKYLRHVCPALHEIEPGKPEDSATPGLRLATVHRVKGLEFDHVILAGRLDEMDAVDETSERFRQKRALLYVAATRARCSLLVCRIPNNQ
jgi:mRNA-degrading endonuclease RelE of RelBE toxin-antitoxin system